MSYNFNQQQFNYQAPPQNKFATLFSFKDVSEKTQQHLVNVYSLLLVSCITCAVGMYCNATYIVNGFFSYILSLILSVYLIYQIRNHHNSQDFRRWCLAGLSFQLGFMVGPAINMLIEVHPEIVIQAVGYTAAAFLSFSALAMFSKRRSYLFVGGIIVTLVQGLALYRLFSWMFGSGSGAINLGYLMVGYAYFTYCENYIIPNCELYSICEIMQYMVGLLTACLYVIYDTQMIIERAEMGDKDEISHALTLFMDVFDLFIKILQILIELQKKEEENNRRKKRDN